jgi:membrane-associated phospholipid phosphatase
MMGARIWRRLTFVDRMYLAWFLGFGAVLVAFAERVPRPAAYAALHLGATAFILVLAAGSRRWRAVRFLHYWYPLLMFIAIFEEVAQLSLLFVSEWQDIHIIEIEAFFFSIPPTVYMGSWASWWFTELMEIGYFSFYVLFLVVGGKLYTWDDKRPFWELTASTVLMYWFCYAFYLGFPTEGPRHTMAHLHTVELTGGPFHWFVELIQSGAGVHGNAFPSAHVGSGVIALVIAWNYLPRLGAWLTPFVILLCAGSVYDRYHYLSDVFGGILVALAAWIIVLLLMANPRLCRALNMIPRL